MKALEVNSLFVTYDGRYAISDISFTADYGDFIAVVGENGSGKSTLVKTLLGLVSPSGGTVTFNGIDKNEIGYLPQQTPAQKDFPASVDEVVLSGCLASMGLRPFYSGTERAAAEKNMARLGITELRRRSYRDLSGGQHIARVIQKQFALESEGLAFYDFSELGDLDGFKDSYRSRLDAAGWSAAERRLVTDETLRAYDLNTRLLQEL